MEVIIPVVSNIFSGLVVNLISRHYINSRCCTVTRRTQETEDIEAEESDSDTSAETSAINCESQMGFVI